MLIGVKAIFWEPRSILDLTFAATALIVVSWLRYKTCLRMERGTCDVSLALNGSFAGKRLLPIEFNCYSWTESLLLDSWIGRGIGSEYNLNTLLRFNECLLFVPDAQVGLRGYQWRPGINDTSWSHAL